MEIKEIKQQLAEYLPYGFVSKIKARLDAKGIGRSRSYISDVCNPEKPAYEPDIIEVAFELAEARKAEIEGAALKAQALKSRLKQLEL